MVPCMALTAHMVTIDCVDPRSLAEFWSQALGYVQVSDLGGYLILRPADGSPGGLTVSLQEVPEPSKGKNRMHLDLEATDRTVEVARLVDLGATTVREHTYSEVAWTVLADPEGNEFCVSEQLPVPSVPSPTPAASPWRAPTGAPQWHTSPDEALDSAWDEPVESGVPAGANVSSASG
jgi:predicted enzyme related to lactoylglutathione lyase